MTHLPFRELGPGYTSEVGTIDETRWCEVLQQFHDANIYQTWPYAAFTGGPRNISHVIVTKYGDVVAAAQARLVRLPVLNIGMAYVRWGPLWRHGSSGGNSEDFRQALRALRNEFVCNRGLVLKVFPLLFDDGSHPFAATVLKEEGFVLSKSEPRGRTILMDLTPELAQLRDGMKPHWRRELKVAERNGLEIIEGTDARLLEAFTTIYREMVSRKKFVEPNDIDQFKKMQGRLPERFKMKVMLCRSGENICAGLVCSAIGNAAIYLFGATSDRGMKSRGSYLLQWKLIEWLKQQRISVYNLNGINPVRNPGTYKFKSDLGGSNSKDAWFLGRFESHAGVLADACVKSGEAVKRIYRNIKERRHSLLAGL